MKTGNNNFFIVLFWFDVKEHCIEYGNKDEGNERAEKQAAHRRDSTDKIEKSFVRFRHIVSKIRFFSGYDKKFPQIYEIILVLQSHFSIFS